MNFPPHRTPGKPRELHGLDADAAMEKILRHFAWMPPAADNSGFPFRLLNLALEAGRLRVKFSPVEPRTHTIMKPIKILGLLALSVCLLSPVEAANKGANKAAAAAAKRKKEEREKKREESAKKRDALKDFMEPLDKNHDGSLSTDEFLEGENDKEEGKKKFDRFNKNGDRSLTKSEIEEMLGL